MLRLYERGLSIYGKEGIKESLKNISHQILNLRCKSQIKLIFFYTDGAWLRISVRVLFFQVKNYSKRTLLYMRQIKKLGGGKGVRPMIFSLIFSPFSSPFIPVYVS